MSKDQQLMKSDSPPHREEQDASIAIEQIRFTLLMAMAATIAAICLCVAQILTE